MPHYDSPTGVNLYYEDVGSGPVVVLLPSTGLSLDVWTPHPVAALSARFRVITFDPRGVGRSKAPDGFLTIEQMAADVAALLTHLDVSGAHVVGHSIGGRVALSLALTHPGLVRSLTMAASGSGSATRVGEDCYPVVPHALLMKLVENGLEEYCRRGVLDTGTFFSEEFRTANRAGVAEFYEQYMSHHADLNWYLRQLTARHIFEASHLLGTLTMPTLVLVGSADTVGTASHLAASTSLAERIPRAELIILPDQAHGFFWQAPELTESTLMAWFDRW